jgi:hypothetical protein
MRYALCSMLEKTANVFMNDIRLSKNSEVSPILSKPALLIPIK